jgi:periplasmic protein TonB
MKKVRSLLLVFCIGVLAAFTPVCFASDQTKKLDDLQAEQKTLLQQLKNQLAAMPAVPDAEAGEPLEVRQRREKRIKLAVLLNDIETRIADDEKNTKRYVSSTKDDPAVASYVARFEKRVTKYGSDNPFKVNGLTRYGKVALLFLIHDDGKFELLKTKSASIKGLGEHAVKLMQQLAPFEPFPAEVSAQGDHMSFIREFNFTKE